MAVQIQLLKHFSLSVVHEMDVLMIAELIVLFYGLMVFGRLREKRCRFATESTSHKTILRNDTLIVDFHLGSRLHLHAIVGLIEIHVVAELNTKADALHRVGRDNTFMVEHEVLFHDELFPIPFLVGVIQHSVSFEHRTPCIGEFQVTMLIDTPRRVAAFGTSSQ